MSHSGMKEQMEKGERKNPKALKFTANTAVYVVSKALASRSAFTELSFGFNQHNEHHEFIQYIEISKVESHLIEFDFMCN